VPLKVALVIPVFNHAASIGGVIEKVRAAVAGIGEVAEIVVVNDGSTDSTAEKLAGLRGVTVLTHARNRGKGAALLTAFWHAQGRGCTHALTVDADGQHEAADIPRMLAAAREHAGDLIIGWRDMESPTCAGGGEAAVPANSKKGRDISRFWLRVQTGQDIPDSQCGLRVYPLGHVLKLRYRFKRFDFETEVLARLAWAGVTIRSVPVTCIYFPRAVRVSHFRPVVDTLRGSRVNVYLVGRRLLPFPRPRKVERAEGTPRFGPWWKWSSWKSAMKQAMRAGTSNTELATAFAVGIFVGLTPFYFVQTILAIYLARRLHLNVIAAVIGSQISIPPLAPLWFLLSYGTGNLLLHGEWITLDASAFSRRALPTLFLGSTIIAFTTAAIGLVLARQILSRLRPNPVTVSAS
jgi:glycosyltransferase involved in cell wall biosynthesis